MEKMYDLNDLLRTSEGARILPVSRATLYRMIAKGQFPKPKKLGARSVWTEQDIQEWRARWLEGSNG